MSFIEDYNAQLYHHGIKGQKWGVRRYQNKDGSLTPAGKKRVRKYEKKLDQINESIFKDKLVARNVDPNDPGSFLGLKALSDKVQTKCESGKKIVDTMKKKGLLREDASFDKYTAKYENKVINDCKKYVSEKYNIKNVTDDDVNYFIEAYLFGAI